MANWTSTPPSEPGWYWWRCYTWRNNPITPYPVKVSLEPNERKGNFQKPGSVREPLVFYNGMQTTFEDLAKERGEWWPIRIQEPDDE